MLLVMHTAGILQRDSEDSQLWKLTWDRIDAFLPSLRDEVFKPHETGSLSTPFLQLLRARVLTASNCYSSPN